MLKRSYAFVDGSYNPKTKVYGCGGFLVDQRGKKHILQATGNVPSMAKMRNVAGEILGAKVAIRKALELHMKKLTLYYDYEGIEKWPTGKWRAKNLYTRDYSMFVKSAMDDGLKLYFQHVKSHTGIPGNEEADMLAKTAVGLIETIVKEVVNK